MPIKKLWKAAGTVCTTHQTSAIAGGIVGALAAISYADSQDFDSPHAAMVTFGGLLGGLVLGRVLRPLASTILHRREAERIGISMAAERAAERAETAEDARLSRPLRSRRPRLPSKAADREEELRWKLIASAAPYWQAMEAIDRRVQLAVQREREAKMIQLAAQIAEPTRQSPETVNYHKGLVEGPHIT